MLQARTYGLSVQAPDLVPAQQMEAFKQWRCSAINLARIRPVEPIDDETFEESDQKMILGYLGFVYKHVFKGHSAWDIGLHLYCQWEFFLQFVHFLVKRGSGAAWLKAHIRTAIHVLDFIRGEVLTESEATRIQSLQDMLG
jgi:hypothetical protein